MAFEHSPGLAALHAFMSGKQELSVEEEKEVKAELEAITKDIEDDEKLSRPVWKGGFGS